MIHYETVILSDKLSGMSDSTGVTPQPHRKLGVKRAKRCVSLYEGNAGIAPCNSSGATNVDGRHCLLTLR